MSVGSIATDGSVIVGGVDPNGKPSGVAVGQLFDDFDTFLTMLTTQLKHQDPLSPMDSTDFTNQLVQFASVEQQIATNTNLEKVLNLTQANTRTAAIGYIGQTIEVGTNQVPLQDGVANFSYTLGSMATTSTIVIRDAENKIVNTLNVDGKAGRHEMTWDGKDSMGVQLKDGFYSLEVVATDTKGETVQAGTTVYGRVTDITADEDATLLAMGKVVVDLSLVLTIRDTKSLQGGTTPPPVAEAPGEDDGEGEETGSNSNPNTPSDDEATS